MKNFIRFSVHHGSERIKILINLEAQKSTNPSKLGYEIDNRIIFYLGRMVSAQKEVEFTNSNYDGLKHVRSIWICMDGTTSEDSINRICLRQENVYGQENDFHNLDKVVGVVIRIRENEEVEESRNVLIAMLEELLRKEDIQKKKDTLTAKFGMIMTEETERRVRQMCNWSDAIEERGIRKGREEGREEELLHNIKNLMETLKLSATQAMDALKIDAEKREGYMERLK